MLVAELRAEEGGDADAYVALHQRRVPHCNARRGGLTRGGDLRTVRNATTADNSRLPMWPYTRRPTERTNSGGNDGAFHVSSCIHSRILGRATEEPAKNRAETVGRAVCEAVGGKLVGGWYCFGEYDLMIIADVPNAECMAAIALAIGAGGAVKSAQTTALMSGAEGVAAMTKAASVAGAYKPAR